VHLHIQLNIKNLAVEYMQGRIIFKWKAGNCFGVRLLIIIKGNEMSKFKNIHPGEILAEEFLIPFNITAYKFPKHCRYSGRKS
jgi:hypothetical protein